MFDVRLEFVQGHSQLDDVVTSRRSLCVWLQENVRNGSELEKFVLLYILETPHPVAGVAVKILVFSDLQQLFLLVFGRYCCEANCDLRLRSSHQTLSRLVCTFGWRDGAWGVRFVLFVAQECVDLQKRSVLVLAFR